MYQINICAKHAISHSHYMFNSRLSHQELQATGAKVEKLVIFKEIITPPYNNKFVPGCLSCEKLNLNINK